MQPVEHHDRKLLDGAVAEFAREFRIEFRFAVLGTHNPDGVGNLQQGIQLDFLFHGNFFLGGAFGTDMQVTDGLLERHVGVFGCQYGAVFEPAAVGATHRSRVVGLAVQHDDHARIAPRGEETDRLLGRFHNDRLGRRLGQRAVGVDLEPDLENLLAIDAVLVFGEQLGEEGFIAFVQVRGTGVLAFGAERTETQLAHVFAALSVGTFKTFLSEADLKRTVVFFAQLFVLEIGFVISVEKIIAIVNNMGYGNTVLRKCVNN